MSRPINPPPSYNTSSDEELLMASFNARQGYREREDNKYLAQQRKNKIIRNVVIILIVIGLAVAGISVGLKIYLRK